ncbi:glycosyltransferase [Confluentibacter flavum]|uniref:Glycosyltransferase n=1 Tax=Confluentibacter flavum TaxID=1909700 RepID=A0A2N3HGZ1_9FLAO|nr:glycosyltransferase [Confluentibacter flavum]PKQ44068.1 glycosyltransferase [Confluentibacter flavum]
MNNRPKKKIVFVLPSLVPGGAERVISFIAQNIDKEKFEPILLIAGYPKDTDYSVKDIKLIYLNKSRVLFAIPSFIFLIIKNKPDIVLSSITHVNTVMGFLSVFFSKIKFIGREVNVLSVKKEFGGEKKFYSSLPLAHVSYKFLDIILCQSKDMYNDMMLNYKIPQEKLRIINNPITDNFKLKLQNAEKTNIVKFITVARLKKQKGHERIIHAISKLPFPYIYTIIGDGPENKNIFNLIDELGIRDKIVHIPYTNEVSKYLAESDLFLQGAFVEGFPNCLIESCAVGVPIIAFRAPGGLNEIIEEGINGFIADTEKEYVESIIKSTTIYQWDPQSISNSVNRKFSKEKILQKYEDLFLEILN